MTLWECTWAHGGHFGAHVGAIVAPSMTLECQKCSLFRRSGGSMLVNGEGLRQRRGSAEGGEASPPSHARFFDNCLARPATSCFGAADLQAAASAADLSGFEYLKIPCLQHSKYV